MRDLQNFYRRVFDLDPWVADFDDTFDKLVRTMAPTSGSIYRTDEGMVVEIPVPGFGESDINAELDEAKGILTITAKKTHRTFREEVFVGWSDVDLSKTTHTCENGMLSFTLPWLHKEKPAKRVLMTSTNKTPETEEKASEDPK